MKLFMTSVAVAALGAAVAMNAGAAGAGWATQSTASAACTSLSTFPVGTGTAGLTNGNPSVAFAPGDRVTISVTMGTATSSSVSIVGNSTGTPVLAGPLVGPGTLSYTVSGALPAGSIGIGYYVNSTTPTGGTVSVAITCADGPPVVVPVWGPLGAAFAAMAAFLIGAANLRKRR